jgi:predicted nuclease of predicted toxin-antitoxin system
MPALKIKLDENLPADLAEPLARLGFDVDTAPQEKLKGKDDPAIWDASQRAGRFLVTQDLYFSDIRNHAPGTHHGILLVRMVDPSRESLFERILEVFEREDVSTWVGCNVVATNYKVRVRRIAGNKGR